MSKNLGKDIVAIADQVDGTYKKPTVKTISKAIVGMLIPSPKKDDQHNTPNRKKLRKYTRYLTGGAVAAAIAIGIPLGLAAGGVSAPVWLPMVLSAAGIGAGVVAARAGSRTVGLSYDFVKDHKDEIETEVKKQLTKVVGAKKSAELVNALEIEGKNLVQQVEEKVSKMKKEDVEKLINQGEKGINFMFNNKKAGNTDKENKQPAPAAKPRARATA